MYVYYPYDGPRHQNLGHLNRKTHNEINQNEKIKITQKVHLKQRRNHILNNVYFEIKRLTNLKKNVV